MKPEYNDILSRIEENPLWYDQNGCPRYDKFHPNMCDIYCKEAVLLLISCQNCGKEFKVGIYDNRLKPIFFSERVAKGENLHYGDPPDIGCCPAGPTMSSNTKQILEFWKQDKFNWIRVPELEKTFEEKDW